MQISTTTIKSSLEIPQKTKDRTAICSSYTTPGHVPKERKTGYNRHLYTDVHCSTPHNKQALETIQVPYN
jgi:hypothetical protein